MKYLSVCSGIEAATVSWHHMGWEPVGFSEIEKFPSAVLAHHYPTVPNMGDMTKYKEWNIEQPDLLVGGTPCQSFSVAGLRKGLDDPRGNLALVYCGILDHFKPRWFIWENVPGVLSSNGGRDFGSFLGALAQLGYGFAYRVLDAQWFGVAQRRKRVFVVGYLGDWRPAAAVLFEPESLRRDTAPSREKRQDPAASTTSSVDANGLQRTVGTLCADTHPGAYSGQDAYTGRLVPSIVGALTARGPAAMGAPEVDGQHYIPMAPIPLNSMTMQGRPSDDGRMGSGIGEPGDPCPTITKAHSHAVAQPIAIQDVRPIEKAQNGRGWNDDGTSYTVDTCATQGVAQPIGFTRCDYGGDAVVDGTPTMRYGSNYSAHLAIAQPLGVFGGQHPNAAVTENQSPTLTNAMGSGGGHVPIVGQMAVRRLTPIECERLQGFPDNYTAIPWRGKAETPDGPRYKALGNSMAVPVMKWIGKRIEAKLKEKNG